MLTTTAAVRLRWVLIALAVLLLSVALKGVVDTFYISSTSEARARAAAGERLIAATALLLLAVAAGLAVLRMTWSAAAAAAASGAFLLVVRQPDLSVATYLMVPVAALLLAGAVAIDLLRLSRTQRRRRGPGPSRR